MTILFEQRNNQHRGIVSDAKSPEKIYRNGIDVETIRVCHVRFVSRLNPMIELLSFSIQVCLGVSE